MVGYHTAKLAIAKQCNGQIEFAEFYLTNFRENLRKFVFRNLLFFIS